MTDDDLHLADQLRARAQAVRATPDLADVERRSSDRHRRRTRAAGAALALIAVLGSVGGFALGRASSDGPPKTFVATGAAIGGGGGDGNSSTAVDPAADPMGSADYAHPFPLLSDRTTADGIRVRVSATPHGSANEGDPCLPDRFVRVGIAADDVIGVVALPVFAVGPHYSGTVGLTGIVDDRWVRVVIVVTEADAVAAAFPEGNTDEAETTDGLAVLASYVDRGTLDPTAALAQEVAFEAPVDDQPLTVSSHPESPCSTDGTTSTTVVTLDGKPSLPPPGDQPADAEAAEQQVRTAFVEAFDQTNSSDEKAKYIERPDIWLEAGTRFKASPYGDAARDLHAEVDEVVFTAPDRASVRFQLVTDDTRVPRYQIGEAVLIDGKWLMSIKVPCELMALAGIRCNYDL